MVLINNPNPVCEQEALLKAIMECEWFVQNNQMYDKDFEYGLRVKGRQRDILIETTNLDNTSPHIQSLLLLYRSLITRKFTEIMNGAIQKNDDKPGMPPNYMLLPYAQQALAAEGSRISRLEVLTLPGGDRGLMGVLFKEEPKNMTPNPRKYAPLSADTHYLRLV